MCIPIFYAVLSTDYSRILIFKEPIFNKALMGHTIRTVKVYDDGGCRVLCYMEPNCVSFNIGPSDDETHTCNLNNGTDDSVSSPSLVDRPHFSYNGAEVSYLARYRDNSVNIMNTWGLVYGLNKEKECGPSIRIRCNCMWNDKLLVIQFKLRLSIYNIVSISFLCTKILKSYHPLCLLFATG